MSSFLFIVKILQVMNGNNVNVLKSNSLNNLKKEFGTQFESNTKSNNDIPGNSSIQKHYDLNTRYQQSVLF